MTLKSILKGVLSGKLDYGENRDYFFMTDEDGRLFFLKKNYGKEDKNCWSQYDDEIIWECETGDNRGLDITESFLHALGIDFAG